MNPSQLQFIPDTMEGQEESTRSESDTLMAVAALFESEFSIDWLLELTGFKATITLGILTDHLRSGVLSQTGAGWFCFNDPLQPRQLTAALTETETATTHRKIMDLLQRDLQQDEKNLDILSSYLIRRTNDISGCRSLIGACELFYKRARHQASVDCCVKAIEDLKQLNGEEADRLFLTASGYYFNSALARSESSWSHALLTEAIRRAETLNDRAQQVIFHMHLTGYFWQNADIAGFHRHFEKARSLAEEISDPVFTRRVESFCLTYYCWQGLNKKTVDIYEKLVRNIDRLPNDYLPLYASTMAAWSHVAVGRLNQGLGMLDAICTHSLKINRPDNFAFAVYYIAETLYSVGRAEEVHQFLTNLNAEADLQYDPRIQKDIDLLHSLILFEKGEIEQSEAGLHRYLKKLEDYREIPYSSYEFLLKFCWAIEQGEYPGIPGLSLEDVIESGFLKLNVHFEALAYRYLALLQKKRGQAAETVLSNLNRSLKLSEESGYLLAIAQTRIEIARIYLKMDNPAKARENAKLAADTFRPHKDLSFPDDLRFLIQDLTRPDTLLEEILHLGQWISTIRDSSDIIKQIILTVIQITGAERGAIFLFRTGNSGDEFELKAAKNLTADDVTQSEFAESMDLIRQTVKTGKGTIKKLSLDRSITYHNYHHIRSCVCIPMIVKNKTVGGLYFDNHFLASPFRQKDLKIFSFFASQAAIAIDNADAYNEVKRLNLKLDKENQYYREQHLDRLRFKDFLGESPAIMQVLSKIEKVAHTRTTVLITGETGVGKELVAGTIMDNSTRSDKPFISVNCSAFSENLIASELFGHEKGAFTGADRQRAGRFELAHGGTLFLDEIGDIPKKVQVRLLRILQTKEFERVGGMQTLKSDFRLIAATNQDLHKLVKSGDFREDLFFRLNVFPIQVPSLRERKEDIPLLAHFFLRIFAKKAGRPFTKILNTEMEKLLAYNWPGNVRELQNIIERGVVL
ncbi:MAG: sigma 54-interacting transcriptional regulator, partial [bacterium]